LFWSFSGDSNLKGREALCDFIASKVLTIVLPAGQKLLDVDVELPTGDWFNWRTRVPSIDLESHAVLQKGGDLVVIPTIDTQRHENLLKALLFNSRRQRAVVLSGPPGSGKSMSLFSCLRSSGSDVDVVGLNFSSSTSPEYLLKTIEQHVEYRKMASGYVMRPKSSLTAKRLVFFCDEINLPQLDDFGTQRVVSFLRQLVEKNGFWRTTDKQWVTLERIQFVGACNPPTDPGRVPLSSRFLRHSSVLMVDYPGKESLIQIYKTFNKAMLKVAPNLKGMSDQLTEAMVSFFLESQSKFTQDQQKHYIYSPRELTRWLRGIYEAIRPIDSGATMVSAEILVRIFAYEALRLFQDRLVSDDERQWTDNLLDRIVKEHFPAVNHKQALQRPILFSSWLTRAYTSVDEKTITSFVDARLRVFYEEEMDMELILYKDAIDHLLRIDRVLRQPQGHLLLIGAAGNL
jgi:dynein heavy chain 1